MKIIFYPKYNNPYQNILKKHINFQVLDLYTIGDKNLALIKMFYDISKLRMSYNIFHLHWPDFKFSSKYKFMSSLSSIYVRIFIKYIKFIGYKFVWTVHNITPHEKLFNDDRMITEYLSKEAHQIIVHSASTINELIDYKIPKQKLNLIPLGNYIKEYPNNLKGTEARNKLSIDTNSFIFTYFGLIRQYKGVIQLIHTFIDSNLYVKSHLVIAGECGDSKLKQEILDLSCKYPESIHTFMFNIPKNDVQIYMNSSDCIVLPYTQVTTSSTAILATSFGKPVIAPRLGSLIDLPENIGYFYNPTDNDALSNAMKIAYKQRNNLKSIGKNALKYAKTLSWSEAGKKTEEVYQKALRIHS